MLARAVQQSAGTIRPYAFTFASNHFHLLVWARGAALAGFMRYVLAHGVKERLMERSAEWPGLTCLPQLLGPARRVFSRGGGAVESGGFPGLLHWLHGVAAQALASGLHGHTLWWRTTEAGNDDSVDIIQGLPDGVAFADLLAGRVG
ncbi:hypothetical protein [Cystobacter fuscus]|uniref:hypothetical protein n=1 Tax=Cystobacter fuscus TaxID=43 RepID=UPI001E5F8C10|nr:hypothetical protein [Cystobacter fuscus]